MRDNNSVMKIVLDKGRVVMVALQILEWVSDDGGDNIGDNVVMVVVVVVEKWTR